MFHGYKLGQKITDDDDDDDDDIHRGERSTEVKCGNYVILLYGYHIWSDVLLRQAEDYDDLHEV